MMLRHRRAFAISSSEIPFARAQDSTAASPYWATAFLTIHPAGNGVRWKGDLQRRNQHDREDHLPSMALTPSQIAPTRPVARAARP